jgi:hypothetical protein
MVVMPLRSLTRYYAQASRVAPTNASMVRVVEGIKGARQAGDVVVLDNNLNDRRVEKASERDEASRFRVLRYIMEFEQVPFMTPDVDAAALAELVANRQGAIVVLSAGVDGRDNARLGDLIAEFGLQSLDGQPARAPRPADYFGVYRLAP